MRSRKKFIGLPPLAWTILLISLGFRCYFVLNDGYLHDWDERYHALVAKNIATDNSFLQPRLYRAHPMGINGPHDWSRSEIWLHKPPLTTWLMAVGIKLFGVNVFAVRFFSLLFVTFALLFTYRVASLLFNERVAIWALGLSAFHGLTNLLITGRVPTDHVDVTFMFFVLFGVWIIVRPFRQSNAHWTVLGCGIALGLAALTKWLTALILLPLFFIYHLGRLPTHKNGLFSMVVLMIGTLLFLPWQLYASGAFPALFEWEQQYNWLHFTQYLEGHHNGPWYFIDKINYHFGEVGLLSILFAIFLLYQRRSEGWKNAAPLVFLLAWTVLPLLVFSLAKTKMQSYLFFTAPAIFILSGVFINRLSSWQPNTYFSRLFSNLILVAAVISPAIRWYESWQFDRGEERVNRRIDEGRYAGWTSSTVVFGSKTPINDMFFSPAWAVYDFVPTASESWEADLVAKGYDVIILSE